MNKKQEDQLELILTSKNQETRNKVEIVLLKGPSGTRKLETLLGVLERSSTPYSLLDDEQSSKIDTLKAYFDWRSKYGQPLIGDSNIARNADRCAVIMKEIPSINPESRASLHCFNSFLRTLLTQSFHQRLYLFIIVNESVYQHCLPALLRDIPHRLVEFSLLSKTALAKQLGIPSIKQKSSESLITSNDLYEISGGDLRFAENVLALMKSTSVTNPTAQPNKKRRVTKSQSSLSNWKVFKRDCELELFHALGKVLYGKRCEDDRKPLHSLPSHLTHHERSPSKDNLEELANEISLISQPETFLLHLSNNLPSFAQTQSFSSVMDSLSYLSDTLFALSDSSLLFNYYDHSHKSWTTHNYSTISAIVSVMHRSASITKTSFYSFKKLDYIQTVIKSPTPQEYRNDYEMSGLRMTLRQFVYDYLPQRTLLQCRVDEHVRLVQQSLISRDQWWQTEDDIEED